MGRGSDFDEGGRRNPSCAGSRLPPGKTRAEEKDMDLECERWTRSMRCSWSRRRREEERRGGCCRFDCSGILEHSVVDVGVGDAAGVLAVGGATDEVEEEQVELCL